MTVPEREHGKLHTYRCGCGCDECRRVARERVTAYRMARFALRVEVGGRLVAMHLPADAHGRASTYSNHGCQCGDCTAAWADAARVRRYRNATKAWDESAPPRKDTL